MQKDFTRPLIVDQLSTAESIYHIKAEKDELLFLRDLLKVQGVKKLEADFRIKLNKKQHIVAVAGNFSASVELQSVISLENFTKAYKDEFSLTFDTNPAPKAKELPLEEEDDFDAEVIDYLDGGILDLGHIAAEQLALVLDDYPRKEGEVFLCEADYEDCKKNPFTVLEKLKK